LISGVINQIIKTLRRGVVEEEEEVVVVEGELFTTIRFEITLGY
jgi:hypothetical protein